jgi:hypothetical protein
MIHACIRPPSGVKVSKNMTDFSHSLSRGCVKSADMKFGNDQIFDMTNFDETSRWMGWSKNEFSHSLTLEPTATAPVVFNHVLLYGH